MCAEHWGRVMDMIHACPLPKHVNLVEVRAYMYACYLERKITVQQWNEFEDRIYCVEPELLLI
jgi:hypothetical protein